MKAYILINTMGGKAKKVLQTIKMIDGVERANGVYGSYDLVAAIEGEDLVDLVVDKIRTIDGVVKTNTLIIAL